MIATASFDNAGNDATLIAAYVIVDGGLGPIISMTDVLHLVSRHCDAEKDDDAHAVIELLHARPPSLSQGAARNLSTVLGNLAYAPLTPVEDRFRHDALTWLDGFARSGSPKARLRGRSDRNATVRLRDDDPGRRLND